MHFQDNPDRQRYEAIDGTSNTVAGFAANVHAGSAGGR